MNMKKFDIDDFINEVDVKREQENDDCEYEVTSQAMKSYLKYPCFKSNWNIILYGGSLNTYFCYDRELKNGYRGDAKYKGAYLLCNTCENKALTADIITSISTPVKKCLTENSLKDWSTGEIIKTGILEKENEDDNMIMYIKAFAFVYYWIGNMMPVIKNWGGSGDNWYNKLNHMFDAGSDDTLYINYILGNISSRSSIDLYASWLYNYYSGNLMKFRDDFYLQDYCDVDIKTKKIIVKQNQSLSKENYKNWFIENSMLIIKRSYRIRYEFKDEWSNCKEHKDNLTSIINKVFSLFGIDSIDLNVDIL